MKRDIVPVQAKLTTFALVLLIVGASAGPTDQSTTVRLVPHRDHSPFKSIALSEDGRFAITGEEGFPYSSGGAAVLWDVATGLEIRRFAEGNQIVAVDVNRDGTLALTGSHDGDVILWDTRSGESVGRMKADGLQVLRQAALSADGKRAVAFSSVLQMALVWDFAKGDYIGSVENVFAIDLAGDDLLACGLLDGTVAVVNLRTDQTTVLKGHTGRVRAVSLSADGQWALSVSDDGTARVWDVPNGRTLNTIGRQFESGAITSNGTRLAFIETPGRIEIHRNGPGPLSEKPQTLEFNHEYGYGGDALALSVDGNTLLTQDSSRSLVSFSIAEPTITPPRVFQSAGRSYGRIALSADGAKLVACTGSPAIVLDLGSGHIRDLTPPGITCEDVVISDNGETVVVTASDRQLFYVSLDAPDGVRKGDPDAPSVLGSIALTSDGRTYLLSDWASPRVSPQFRLQDVATDTEIWSMDASTFVGAGSALSADGRVAVMYFGDGSGIVFDGRTGRVRRKFDGYGQIARALVSDDGARLVAVDQFAIVVRALDSDRVLARLDLPDLVTRASGRLTANESRTRILWCPASQASMKAPKATLWDIPTGAHVDFAADDGTVSGDGRLLALRKGDGTIELRSLQNPKTLSAGGELLATLVLSSAGRTSVVAPGGRFDGIDFNGEAPFHWIATDEPLRPLPLEIFMRPYYTPRLLPRLLAGEKLPPVPGLETLNRLQPRVEIVTTESDPAHDRSARVRVKVMPIGNSGARDLRLFRDGQMVGIREGPVGDNEYVFDQIRLPSKESVEFSVYVFNDDLVKSETVRARYVLPTGGGSVPRPRAFVVSVGVNRSSASGCDLRYAVSDAVALRDTFQKRLGSVSVEATLLVSTDADPNGASKASLRAALAEIARQATPDDIFLLSFSGHGYTDAKGQFYIFPSDLIGNCGRADELVLGSAVSSDELSDWLRVIDAGEMIMILDACYSGASVDSGDFKPGPMGSQGLGQLAYDKRIRILAASQSTQAAIEAPWLQMGFLSYALVRDGLESGQADWEPKDAQIWLREWLTYAVERVPKLYDALRLGRPQEFGSAARGVILPQRPRNYRDRAAQTPVLFDFAGREQGGFRLR